MERLSVSARVYYFGIVSVATVGVLAFLSLIQLQISWAVLFWIALYILADYSEARLKIGKKDDVVLTITEAIVVFLVIVSGGMGVIVTIIGTLVADLLNQRKIYQCVFNIAQRCIIYLVLWAIYTVFAGVAFEFVVLLLLGVAHYIIDIALVGSMIALATKQSWWHVYRVSYSNTTWVHAITLPTGMVMALLWSINPLYIVLSVGPLILALYGFRMIAELTTQNTLVTFLGLMVKMRREDTEVSNR